MVSDVQELVCHCGCVNTFPINSERDGNYIIVCKCKHKHYRKCVNGITTDIRWGTTKKKASIFVKTTQRKYEQRDTQKRPKNDNGFLSMAWLNSGG